MGFKKDSSSDNTSRNPDGYINIALPLADGSTAKLGACRIYFDGKDGEANKAMFERLQDPEQLAKFQEALVITANYGNVAKAAYAF